MRIWKGYRDAQCGWVEAAEDDDNPVSKRALFLTIYAPKRGVLEIWCCQMGPRVAAFNVGKTCRVVHCGYSMIGLNDFMLAKYKSYADFHTSRCFILDFATASLFTLKVPFLCALTDRSSKRTRDVHLLREFRNLLREDVVNRDKLRSVLLAMRTAEVKREALEALIASMGQTAQTIPEVLIELVSALKTQMASQSATNELDYENQLICQACAKILQLFELYSQIESLKTSETAVDNDSPVDIQYLVEALNWNGSDIARYLSLLSLKSSKKDLKPQSKIKKSQKESNQSVTFTTFLSSFQVFSNHVFKHNNEIQFDQVAIELTAGQKNSANEALAAVSNFIFLKSFTNEKLDVAKIKRLLQQSCISPSDLLFILFTSWMSSSLYNNWKTWEVFNSFATAIVDLIPVDVNLVSETTDDLVLLNWNPILHLVVSSDNLPASLIAVQVIRTSDGLLRDKETQEAEKADKSLESVEEWETLHVEAEQLNLLARQLEDVLLLELLLKSAGQSEHSYKIGRLCLSGLLKSGAGIVSELVAEWAVASQIEPDSLFRGLAGAERAEETSEDASGDVFGIEGAEEASKQNLDVDTSIELLSHVRRRFPHSLEPDVLMANCAWELIMTWDKAPSLASASHLTKSFDYLNAIQNAVLRHNVMCLAWRTYLQKRFEALAGLMQKMGKAPKDRICKKELGLSEDCLESYLLFAINLLELVYQTIAGAEVAPVPPYAVDEWWREAASSLDVSRSAPLALLAAHHRIANVALVLEHIRLATVMLFVVAYQLKSAKPLSLFSSTSQQYMFRDFNTPFMPSNASPAVVDGRQKFLAATCAAIASYLPASAQSGNHYYIN